MTDTAPQINLQEYKQSLKEATQEFHSEQSQINSELLCYERATVDFALSGIKSLFIVNAGAISILPVYWKFAGVDLLQYEDLIIKAIVIFMFSLVFTTITNLLAYFTESSKGMAWQHYRFFAAERVWKKHLEEYLSEEVITASEDKIKEHEHKHNKAVNSANRYRTGAILSFLFAFLLFVYGCFVNINILSERTFSVFLAETIKSRQMVVQQFFDAETDKGEQEKNQEIRETPTDSQ